MIQLPSGTLMDLTDIAVVTKITAGTKKKPQEMFILYMKGNPEGFTLTDDDAQFIRDHFKPTDSRHLQNGVTNENPAS